MLSNPVHWMQVGGHVGGAGLRELLAEPLRWFRRQRERRELASLSDDMLRDIGLIRADVEREYLRPMWEEIDYAGLEARRRRALRS
jgi:uncharacterized protein YjiS (DUF1127 family)